MKKNNLIIYVILGILFVSCANKEVILDESKSSSPTIIGVYDDQAPTMSGNTKTAYNAFGEFSWEADDQITVQLTNGASYSNVKYKANSGGSATSSFSLVAGQSIPEGYELGDYAFYPREVAYTTFGYNNDYPVTVNLPAHTYDYTFIYGGHSALRTTPLVGKKTLIDGDNVTFDFVTAAGILKLNFTNVKNVAGLRLYLNHPTYPLCGNFSLSEDNTILASNYISGKEQRLFEPTPAFSEVYVALPISDGDYSTGIPAGLDILLQKTDGSTYAHITTSTPILIERNTITELSVPIVAVESSVSETITGTSAAPMATITVAPGESVAIAGGSTKDEAIANLYGKVWYSESGTYDITGMSVSGATYLAYKVKKKDANEVEHVYLKYAMPTPFYYLSSTDASSRVGTYKHARSSGMSHSNLVTNGDDSITFEVSDNPTKGNLMITQAFGFCNEVLNSTHSTVATYDFSQFTDGSPIYGCYNPASAAPQLVFSNTNQQVFYYDGNGVPHYISEYSSSRLRFQFDSNANFPSEGPYNLVCYGRYIMNCYNTTSNYDFWFEKYCANKVNIP